MTLVNTRAAFEAAITDAVKDVDPTVTMIYDNVSYTKPGKNVKYIVTTINFGRATQQAQGDAQTYYSGFIQSGIYVPKGAGTSVLAALSEAVITGMTSVNSSTYVDTYSCNPRVGDVVGPGGIDNEDESHYLGVITCQFSANG